MSMQVIELEPIGNGTGVLVGRCKLQMLSEAIYECRIYRNKDGTGFTVGIAGSKNFSNGKFAPIVTFATAERSRQWAELALKAVEPHLHKLQTQASAPVQGAYDDRCPF